MRRNAIFTAPTNERADGQDLQTAAPGVAAVTTEWYDCLLHRGAGPPSQVISATIGVAAAPAAVHIQRFLSVRRYFTTYWRTPQHAARYSRIHPCFLQTICPRHYVANITKTKILYLNCGSCKNLAYISYISGVIAHFVQNFVAMTTKVGRGRTRLAVFDGPWLVDAILCFRETVTL